MEKNLLQTLIGEAGYETRAYSGRGMYGKECLACDPGESLGHFISDVMEALRVEVENQVDGGTVPGHFDANVFDASVFDAAIEGFRSMATDSMGRGQIVYFPGVPFIPEDKRVEVIAFEYVPSQSQGHPLRLVRRVTTESKSEAVVRELQDLGCIDIRVRDAE